MFDNALNALHYINRKIVHLEKDIFDACRYVTLDKNFLLFPASCDKHHAYSSGLLIHTAEVLQYATELGSLAGADQDVLVPAAIWHDYAKIYDYAEIKDEKGEKKWTKTPYCTKIRHVVGSYHKFMSYMAGKAVGKETLLEDIGHAMLAHHGRYEWGSPVEPRTKEALILHQADMLSANYPGR